ncbi:MAG TPA: DnaA/Hda family protein [Roseiarcus sp.]|nr:DnaA/Hda family protein [Roseiarcus sp.]
MTPSPRQLTLNLPHSPSFARDDFLVAPSNREAFAAIDAWPRWPARMLLLVGPEGSGKSHLAALWAEKAAALTVSPPEPAGSGVAEAPAFLIEDADRVGEAEVRLFHLLNAALQTKAWVLLTARTAPDAWGLKLPDLLSRLRLAPVARLETPDLELTEGVLVKLFSDRQLQVEPRVVSYIAMRIERSLGAARQLVDLLDREALAQGRRVSRTIATQFLREFPESMMDTP